MHLSHTNLAPAARPRGSNGGNSGGSGAHSKAKHGHGGRKEADGGGSALASAASTWSLGELDAQQLAQLDEGRVPVRHLLCYLSLLQAARPQDKLECTYTRMYSFSLPSASLLMFPHTHTMLLHVVPLEAAR